MPMKLPSELERKVLELAGLSRVPTLPPDVTEKAFTAEVIRTARMLGWKVAHFRPGRVTRNGEEKYETAVAGDGRGFPDLLLIRGQVMLVAELKVKRNKPSPEQAAWLNDFAGTGIEAFVWRPEDWPSIQQILGRTP